MCFFADEFSKTKGLKPTALENNKGIFVPLARLRERAG